MDLAFPDICKTPPAAMAPIPYPDIGLGMMAMPVAWNVNLVGMPAHNLATITPITLGDTVGAGGGIRSQTFMSKSQPVLGANTVVVCGTPLARLGSLNSQNCGNMIGMRIVPSQLKILVLAP